MIELTTEDKQAVGQLAQEVVEVLNAAGIEGDERETLAPLIWQDLRAAHIANKQTRVQQEQMEIAKKAGLGNHLGAQVGPSGYYGQKL